MESINQNLGIEPEYFYRVSEFVTTFGKDLGKNDSFSHDEDFKGKNLLECKSNAEKYYYERLKGFENGKYFLPFATPIDFEPGKNASCSINLSLVEWYSESDQFEYPLIGEDEDSISDSKEVESRVLKQLGYIS